jgi:hypothetical protein
MGAPFFGELLTVPGLVSIVGVGVILLYVVIVTSNLLKPFIAKIVRSRVVQRFENAGVQIGKHIVVHDDQVFWEWAKGGSLAFGESFMAKMWDVGSGFTLDEIVTMLARLPAEKKREFKPWNWRLVNVWYKLFNMQSVSRADIIAKKHYNLGNEFFKLVHTVSYHFTWIFA